MRLKIFATQALLVVLSVVGMRATPAHALPNCRSEYQEYRTVLERSGALEPNYERARYLAAGSTALTFFYLAPKMQLSFMNLLGPAVGYAVVFAGIEWLVIADAHVHYARLKRIENLLLEAEAGGGSEIRKLIDDHREFPDDERKIAEIIARGDQKRIFCRQNKPYSYEEIVEWLTGKVIRGV